MINSSLQYNTGRGKLLISEYGRIVQQMVEAAVEEPDREKRQRMANDLIRMMAQLNPGAREHVDFKQKLWDHLFIMSDYKLEVDAPYPMPTPEHVQARPSPLGYPQSRIRFRFYGKIVPKMIERVAELEDGPYRTAYINAIGSFMKMSSKAWNLEMLNDNEVMAHLEEMSHGKINMHTSEDLEFRSLQQRKVNAIGEDKGAFSQQHRGNQNRNKFNKKNRNNNFRHKGR